MNLLLKRGESPVRALEAFTQAERPRAAHRCEMCGAELAPFHGHVVNVASRTLLCTCSACRLLFTSQGAARGRFKAVPERYLHLREFQLVPESWERLEIPVGIAFFFFNSALKQVTGFYPSPAGAIQSTLPLAAWDEIIQAHPALADLEPDVEALLVYCRRGQSIFDGYLVPIDACYELTGRVRRYWRGFDGGADAWREIEAFFTDLAEKSRLRAGGGAR